MTVSRQDAWTADEDLLLTKLVLHHIRDGSTQLRAFEEAGKNLNRTAAACGFRWNSNLRKQHKKEIENAKRQRKEKRSEVVIEQYEELPQHNDSKEITYSNAVEFFQNLESDFKMMEMVKNENSRLRDELERERTEKNKVIQSVAELEKNYHELKEEYHSLIILLDKARKLADGLATAHNTRI